MSNVPPVMLSAIVCERVIFDKMTGMPSIINILQGINSPKYPVRYSQLVFFCELTNGHGITEAKVRITDSQQDDKVLFEKEGEVQFKDVRQVVTMAMGIKGVKFDSTGEYRFQLFSEGSLLGERRIICRETPKKPDNNQQ
jgi:hypothetical protein